jgi:hypothetical protein
MSGDDALRWYGDTHRDGGHIADVHLRALHQVFGPDVRYEIVAASGRTRDEPRELIIEIDQSVDDDDSWSLLEELQESVQDELLRSPRAQLQDEPFADIVVVLRGRPRSWPEVVNRIEHLE